MATVPGGSIARGMKLTDRGNLVRVRGLSAVADLPMEIAERQQRQAMKRLLQLVDDVGIDIETTALPTRSKGTVLLLLAEFEQSQACFFGLGARGKRAERVADEAVDHLAEFLATEATVDRWMADQLLLPRALADSASEFATCRISRHLLTNAEVIRRFHPVTIAIEGEFGEPGIVRIS